jgi:uncharacterized membrane protein
MRATTVKVQTTPKEKPALLKPMIKARRNKEAVRAEAKSILVQKVRDHESFVLRNFKTNPGPGSEWANELSDLEHKYKDT